MDSHAPRPDPPAFPGFPVRGTERIYDSPWCGLRRDDLVLPGGREQEYHVVEIPDAVVVVPVLADGRIVMIWQYRYPVDETHWEVPAGRIHDDEDPPAAAARELREETGYAGARLERIGGFFPINGISPHYGHVFVAHDCARAGELQLEDSERIATAVFDREEVAARLREGAFQDGFTALALFYFMAGDGGIDRPLR